MKKKRFKFPSVVYAIECVDSGHIASVVFLSLDKAMKVCERVQSISVLNTWRVTTLFVNSVDFSLVCDE